MSRGLTNNNPGNIRHSSTRWQGELAVSESARVLDADFKTFMSMAYGYRAMFKLLHNYSTLYGISTLEGMIFRWAPPVENNSSAYLAAVASWSGIAPSSRVDTTDSTTMTALVSAMSRMENGALAVAEDVFAGWELFAKEL